MSILLLIGSGEQLYREYTLCSAAERYSLVLLQEKPITWQKQYLLDSAQVPMDDRATVLAAARSLAEQYPFAGLLTYEELSVELASAIAAELHLPYNDTACAHRCRDKLTMRQTFEQAGVPSATSCLVTSLHEAATAAEKIGYPVVLKPRALGGSIGVVRVDSLEELPAAYSIVTGASLPRAPIMQGILVEEYLEGPEVSVESVVADGKVHIVAITRKKVGFAPYFEKIGHVVSPGDPLTEEAAIHDTVLRAHRALGLQLGITHSELRLTPRGPRMIELAARLGGDLIPYLVYLATGIDLAAAAVDAAAGKPLSLQPSRQRSAAVQFFYPQSDVKVRALAVDSCASDLPWLDQINWQVQPGDELRLPPHGFLSRLGFIIVTGENITDCEEHLGEAMQFIHMKLEPLSHGMRV